MEKQVITEVMISHLKKRAFQQEKLLGRRLDDVIMQATLLPPYDAYGITLHRGFCEWIVCVHERNGKAFYNDWGVSIESEHGINCKVIAEKLNKKFLQTVECEKGDVYGFHLCRDGMIRYVSSVDVTDEYFYTDCSFA